MNVVYVVFYSLSGNSDWDASGLLFDTFVNLTKRHLHAFRTSDVSISIWQGDIIEVVECQIPNSVLFDRFSFMFFYSIELRVLI